MTGHTSTQLAQWEESHFHTGLNPNQGLCKLLKGDGHPGGVISGVGVRFSGSHVDGDFPVDTSVKANARGYSWEGSDRLIRLGRRSDVKLIILKANFFWHFQEAWEFL